MDEKRLSSLQWLSLLDTVNMFSIEEVSDVKPSCHSSVRDSLYSKVSLPKKSCIKLDQFISQFHLHKKCVHALLKVQGPSFQWTLSTFLYTSQTSAVETVSSKTEFERKKNIFCIFLRFWLLSKLHCIYLLAQHALNVPTMPVFW